MKLSKVRNGDTLLFGDNLVGLPYVLRAIFKGEKLPEIEFLVQDEVWDKNLEASFEQLNAELLQGKVSTAFPLKDINTLSIEIDIQKCEIKEIDEKSCKYIRKINIFRMDEDAWYAAHNLMEFLNWYDKYVCKIEDAEQLESIEILEPEDGFMWSNINITQEDIEALGDCEETVNLIKRDGEILKYQTFADVLKNEDITEPYEIASTNW